MVVVVVDVVGAGVTSVVGDPLPEAAVDVSKSEEPAVFMTLMKAGGSNESEMLGHGSLFGASDRTVLTVSLSPDAPRIVPRLRTITAMATEWGLLTLWKLVIMAVLTRAWSHRNPLQNVARQANKIRKNKLKNLQRRERWMPQEHAGSSVSEQAAA